MSGSSWPVRSVLLLALVLLALLVWFWLAPEGPRSLVAGWFGPPRVRLAEAYVSADGGELFDHSRFDGLLREFVDEEGFVDYAGLGGKQTDLERYLEAVAAVPFHALSRNEKLALSINAYNAFTLNLILEHYPLASIRDIPSEDRWDAVRWNIGGEICSLNQIEHEQIRPNFREPRIHFALVCAAVGCPPLRRRAYTGEGLESQLEDQALRVHTGERWFRYTPQSGRVELTSLYEWYRGDFEQVAGSVLEFAARFRPSLAADLESGHRPELEFLDYDWSLNGLRE